MSSLNDFGGDYQLQFGGIMDITNWSFMALRGPFKLHSTHQGGRKQSKIIGLDWLNKNYPALPKKQGIVKNNWHKLPCFNW